MNLVVVCFTRRGCELICNQEKAVGMAFTQEQNSPVGDIKIFCKCRALKNEIDRGDYGRITYWEENISELARQCFLSGDAMLFVGATGIAVRTIAPFVKDKLKDIPVMVMDDNGRYIIPILSGHVGGANRLAEFIGGIMGAAPVITTSTDNNNAFAVDVFAGKNKLNILNKSGIARVSSKVLEGCKIRICVPDECNLDTLTYERFCDDNPDAVEIVYAHGNAEEKNSGFNLEKYNVLIADSDMKLDAELNYKTDKAILSADLVLEARDYIIGIGCRKDKSKVDIETFTGICLRECGVDWNQVYAIASIDKKKDEQGLIELAQSYGYDFVTFSAEELESVEGDFEDSDFVRQTVGVGNVCERAAIRAAGAGAKLIYKKKTGDGVTVAVAKRIWRIGFEE